MMISNITDTLWSYSPGLNVCLKLLKDLGPGIAAGIAISEIAIQALRRTQHVPTASTESVITRATRIGFSELMTTAVLSGLVECNTISPAQGVATWEWAQIAIITATYFALRTDMYRRATPGAPIAAIPPAAYNVEPDGSS